MHRVDGFTNRSGEHCGSTCLGNLAGYYGWGVDEPTAFGLASGVGFAFFRIPDRPHRAFFGRPLWLEVAFFDHVGIRYDHRNADDWASLWDTIRTAVDDGDPVLVFTDVHYVDYYDTAAHVSPHSMLVVGYDESGAETTVELSDNEFEDCQTMPVESLREAMTSPYLLGGPRRRLTITDATRDRSFPAAATAAIRTTARYMLDPEAVEYDLGPGQQGVDGIRALAADLPEWSELPDPRSAARFGFQNVEQRGTGGGCFRRLYAGFLASAVESVPTIPVEVNDRMRDIADDWTAFGETLASAGDCDDPDARASHLSRAGDDLARLADREERLYRDLLDATA